jgi:leader peptidase (prepilin peptidase)/N-methyltransferase
LDFGLVTGANAIPHPIAQALTLHADTRLTLFSIQNPNSKIQNRVTITDINLFLAQTIPSWWLLQHVPLAIFVFCFGACVGSFLNVVIYRLPAGMSVISPPSRCPVCGARLRFFSENLPILGWFVVRGRCRYCKARISPQYMIIELLMALVFLGLYIVLYAVKPSTPWWGEIGGPWWYQNGYGAFRTWPAFIAMAFMLAGLVAMTVIDARTFTIPIQIPLFVTITAFIAYPLQALLPLATPRQQAWPIPALCWPGLAMVFGAMLGVVIAYWLLRTGRFHYSFADYHEFVKEGETLGDYPHARREMAIELLYLLPCLTGAIAGWLIGKQLPATPPPIVLQALGGSFAGYLMGGALIWGIRILGTLGFGREAMGLGDVHLLGAIGAVLGWFDPILIFFIAPFSGLAWAFLSMGISSVFKRARRELPYGPHLAVATLVVILCRPGLQTLWHRYMPSVPWPQPGLCQAGMAPRDASGAIRGSMPHPPANRPAGLPSTTA